jgi:hypothetical protein
MDRWRRIEELYHAARLLNDSARASFLAAATEGDEELRREVGSLPVSGASSPGFLDEPIQVSVIEPSEYCCDLRPRGSRPFDKLRGKRTWRW